MFIDRFLSRGRSAEARKMPAVEQPSQNEDRKQYINELTSFMQEMRADFSARKERIDNINGVIEMDPLKSRLNDACIANYRLEVPAIIKQINLRLGNMPDYISRGARANLIEIRDGFEALGESLPETTEELKRRIRLRGNI